MRNLPKCPGRLKGHSRRAWVPLVRLVFRDRALTLFDRQRLALACELFGQWLNAIDVMVDVPPDDTEAWAYFAEMAAGFDANIRLMLFQGWGLRIDPAERPPAPSHDRAPALLLLIENDAQAASMQA